MKLRNREIAQIVGRRRLPAALLAAAGIILAIELLVALLPQTVHKDLVRHRLYHPNVPPDIAESIVQWQVAHATLVGEQQDLLLLGDSACLVGLESNLLMERTGLKTWNLGTFGFIYTTGQADILKLFIERNGPPRFLVYHTSHYSFTAGRDKKAVRTWVGRLREWLAAPETVRYLLPSMRHRQKIRNVILALGKESVSYTGLDVPRGRFASDNEIRKELWENRGSLPDPQEVDLEEELGDGLVWEPRFNPDCVEGLKRIFELGREHGFPVLILFNPLPEQGNTGAITAAMDKLEADLKEVIEPYPWVSIYEPFTRFYPNELCIDMRHVNVKGTRRNTEEMVEWIRANWLDRSDQ
ncbi:MAG: hypothetical protein V1789_00960 [PVC group bacterium]